MTLKTSFLGSMIQNLKRRSGTIALTVVTLFFVYPVIFLLMLSSSVDRYVETKYRMQQLMNVAGGYFNYNAVISIMFGALGVILAFQAFGFLHKKNKMDLYNSVPVSYNRRFLVIVVNSFLILAVSTAACYVLCLIILGSYRVFAVYLAWRLFVTMATGVLFAMGMFFITALAICLTGNTVVALCAVVIFAAYEITCSKMMHIYMEKFFRNYDYQHSGVHPKFSIIYYMSEIINAGEKYYYSTSSNNISMNAYSSDGHTIFFSLVMIFVITLVTCLLTWLCFKKRPSEAAGRSMAFQKTKRVIKYMIMIPATLIGAELSERAEYGSSLIIFGAVLTAVMGCMMIEIIYEGDIKSALKHLVDIPVILAVASIIFGIYSNDIFGYDSYIPKKASLKGIGFTPSSLYHYGRCFKIEKDGELSLIDDTDYMLNYYFDDEEVMDVILNAAKNSINNNGYKEEGYVEKVIIKYVLKNGQEKYRSYRVLQSTYREILDVLESKEAYFKACFQGIFELRDYTEEVCIIDASGDLIEAPHEDIAEILDAYAKDLENTKSVADFMEKKPIGIVCLGIVVEDDTLIRDSLRYPIFEDFDNTITCLENKGLYYTDYLENRTIEAVSIYQFKVDENGNFMCNDEASVSTEEMSGRTIFAGSVNAVFGSAEPVYNRRWSLPVEREDEIRELVDFGFSRYLVYTMKYYINFWGGEKSVGWALETEYDSVESNVRYVMIIDWKKPNGYMKTDYFNIMPKGAGRLEEILRLYGKEE